MNLLKVKIKILLSSIITKLETLRNQIAIENNSKQLPNYEDLAPISDANQDSTYADAILNALRNENITNIALTGPYGSGKSSILRTFEKNNPSYAYLNITLASFDENIQINQEARNTIELSILQQIFYRVKDSDIPDSRFKRIKKLTKKNQRSYTALLVLWIIIGVITFKPELIQINKSEIDFLHPYQILIHDIGLLIFLCCIAYIIFHSLRLLRNSKVNKVNLTSGEVELSGDAQSSVLNKYLDEIVYFFEATKYDTVIIEDLDRFKDPEIFTKLRELNTLLNQSKQIGRRIVFVYAVKDDMFLDETRTKFFEFIIPVIPIINPSNSGDVLSKKLVDIGMMNNISQSFINDITLYVDDMRMLKNIVNEFRIYKIKIGEKLNDEKLLAMIFYKNLYPTDFSDLHADKGIVYTVFNDAQKYIQPQVETIEDEIKNLARRIEIIDSTHLNDISELKLIYLSTLFMKISANSTLYINNSSYTLSNALNDDIFFTIQQQRTFTYSINGWSYSALNISFKEIEKEVDSKRTFNERKTNIEIKTKSDIDELRSRLDELKLQKRTISNWTLKKIMSTVSITVFSESFLSKKLLVYLVRHGFIDESYYTYISYFYEGSLTKEDRDYLLSVKNHEALDYSHRLNKIENIITRLHFEEFYQTEILNYNFLNFLIQKRYSYQAQLDSFFEQLKEANQRSIEFIDNYLNQGEEQNEFFSLLCNRWNGLWNFIVKKSNYSTEKKNNYLVRIVQYARIEDVFLMDDEGMLSLYISKQSNFLLLFKNDSYYERIREILKGFGIKFNFIENPSKSQYLFDFVYENNLYELNPKMVETVFVNKNSNSNISIDDFRSSNYTSMLNSQSNNLIKYVEDNISKYIEDVLLSIDSNNEETQATVIQLLNNTALHDHIKLRILKKQNAVIVDITDVDKSVWDLLLDTLKVGVDWNNILNYYKEKQSITDKLVSYLNVEFNYKILSEIRLNTNDETFKETIESISRSIITCNDLSDQSYLYLLNSIPYYFSKADISELSSDKVDSLIKQKRLGLSEESYTLLRDKFYGKHINFLEQWIDEFLETHKAYEIDENDFVRLFDSTVLSQKNKVALLEIIDKRTITKASGLADKIYRGVIRYSLQINKSLLFNLLGKLQNRLDEVNLLNSQFNSINSEEVEKALNQIGEDYSLIINKGLSELPYHEINQKLLKSLKDRDIISRVSKEKNRLKITY